jgi:polyhydroxybutyrate depolymerase
MAGYSRLVRVADREGFLVAFPTARSGEGTWELQPEEDPSTDDVAAVRVLLDRVAATACVESKRVTAVGVSNGGGFTARLACEMSDRLAGVAVVAGGFARLPPCRPAHPMPLLEIHGTADRVVPYLGDPEVRGGRGAVRPWLAAWARRDGCRPGARRRPALHGVVRIRWRGCAGGSKVEHIAILGGQHAWPGASPPDPGPSPVSAAEESWRFLAGATLR